MTRRRDSGHLHDISVIAALHRAEKLRRRCLLAAMRLAADCAAARGSSAGVVGSYGEASGACGRQERLAPAYRVSAAAQRLEQLIAYMHPAQRAFLGELLQHHGRPWNALQAWGAGAGYRSDDAQRAAGVQRVLDLLESVADFYGVGGA